MFLGFGIYDATKIMGLSAYGDPKRLREQYAKLIWKTPEGQFRQPSKLLRFYKLDYIKHSGYFKGLEQVFGIKKRTPDQELEQIHYDMAAALQEVTDEVLLHIVTHLHEQTKSDNLCLAGGVALNCVSNARVFEQGPFSELYVQPAAHDAGTALGTAMFICHQTLGCERSEPMEHAYVGPDYSDSQIEEALRHHNLKYERCDNIELEVAKLIANSEVVGWSQGRMEIGPRALGNRSLLADPRHPKMRDILNSKVKHREFFRPFAPSVLKEKARDWFQIAKESSASDFMLMAYPVIEAVREKIPAVIHADGTSRIQTVRQDTNSRYHKMISEFEKLTGVPIVLNTSYNDSEPIVCSPDDAIDTFLKTKIDHLAIGNFLVRKEQNRQVPRLRKPRTTPTMQKVFPELANRLEDVVSRKRVTLFGDLFVVSDSIEYYEADQVLPLYGEQQFFLDELARERMEGANVLEIGIGSGVLSMLAARAGARRVTALEVNPRAKIFAGFNVFLNGLEKVIEIRDGHKELYRNVQGEKFDYLICNPPFMPTPPNSSTFLHSAAGIYGLDFVQDVLKGMNQHLTETGYAQIVTLSPGTDEGPTLLTKMVEQYAKGRATIRFAREAPSFSGIVEWSKEIGFIDEEGAKLLLQRAESDGVTRCYLCMVHYDRQGPQEVTAEPAARDYHNWQEPSHGVELSEADRKDH